MWHGKTILHITSTKFSLQELVNVDVVIIGNNAVKNLEIFRTNLQAEKIVFDSSNSFSYAERMIKNAALLNLNIHSVLQQGAFQVIIDSDT